MKKENINKDQNLSDAQKRELYEDLWVELEPRLKKPRKKRRLIWFFGIALLLITAWYTLQNKRNSTISANNEIERKSASTTQTQINTPIAEIKKDDNISIQNNTTEQAIKKSNPTNEKFKITEKSKISNTIQNNLAHTNFKLKEWSLANQTNEQNFTNTKSINQSSKVLISSNLNHNSSKNELTSTPKVIQESRSIYSISTLSNLSLRLLETNKYNPKLIDQNLIEVVTKKQQAIIKYYKFQLGFKTSLAILSATEISNLSGYQMALDQSLDLDFMTSFQLSGYYSLSRFLSVGMGLNYSKVYERFALNNTIEYESTAINPEAYQHEDYFIALEQDVNIIESQHIQNNNVFNILSVVPQVSAGFDFGKLRLSADLGLPIVLSQSYSGTLFDQDGRRIYSGEVFDQKSFTSFGLNLHSSLSYRILDRWSIGIGADYRRFNSDSQASDIYRQSKLQSIGGAVDLQYSF